MASIRKFYVIHIQTFRQNKLHLLINIIKVTYDQCRYRDFGAFMMEIIFRYSFLRAKFQENGDWLYRCWWQRCWWLDFEDKIRTLVTEFRYWWHLLNIGARCLTPICYISGISRSVISGKNQEDFFHAELPTTAVLTVINQKPVLNYSSKFIIMTP